MAAALSVTGFRVAVAGGEEDLAEAKKLIQQFAEAGKLSKKDDAEVMKRLESRGLFSGEKGAEVRLEATAYLTKVRDSKLMQREPAPRGTPLPAPRYVEAVPDIADGAGSILTPADIDTAWINEAGLGPFRLNPPPATTSKYAEQLILANVGAFGIGYPPAEISQVEVNIRQVSTTQNVVVELKFWDAFDGLQPLGSHCLVGLLGTYTADFGVVPSGASAYPATMNLVPPLKTLDSEVFVEVSYFVSAGGPYALGCTTQFFCGTAPATPQVGGSFAGWLMDANGDSVIDVSEIFDFASPNNDADFRMHVRATAPTTETEPNNTQATATPTACGLTLAGSTDPAGDVDFYSFTLTSGALVTAEVLCGGADSTLTLRDSGGASIQFSDDEGPGLCSIITRALTPGTYALEVHEFGDNGVMPYSLALTCAALDETEPNNDTATADATTCGTTKSGLIDPAGDTDFWTFTLASQHRITATLNSGAGDATLSLQDGGGQLAFADNFAGGTPEVIVAIIPAGTYYLECREFGDDATFSYSLALACHPIDETEPNNTEATASAIACGQNLGGILDPAGDLDFWTFSVIEQTAITAEVVCGTGDSLLDLYDAGSTLLASSDDEGPGLCSLISTLVPAGTYYLRVRDFGDNSVMPYTLNLQCVEVPVVDEVEPNDDSANANAISCGTPLRGIISSPTDVDFWVNTEIVALSLVSVRVDTPTSSLDPTLTILDSALNPVAFNDDWNGVDSQIDYLLFPDTYYFVVDSFSGSGATSTYTLSVTCSAPVVDDQGCIVSGHTLNGSIDVAGVSDTYTFTAGAAGTAIETVRMIAKSATADLNIVVADNTGALVDRDEDDADVVDAQVYFDADVTRTFTVYVSAAAGETGAYTLSCEFIRTVTGVETEPNDTIPQTDDIGHFARILGTISSGADEDRNRFFLGAGDVITMRCLTGRGNDNTPNAARDLQIEIQDSAGATLTSDDDGDEDFDAKVENFVLPASVGFTYYGVVSNVSGPGDYDLFFLVNNVPFTMTPNQGVKLPVGAEVRAALTAINPSVQRKLDFKIERLLGGVPTLLISRTNVNAPPGLNKVKPNVLLDTVPNLPSGTVIRYRATCTVNGRPVTRLFDVQVQ